jgi:hypothetical protein
MYPFSIYPFLTQAALIAAARAAQAGAATAEAQPMPAAREQLPAAGAPSDMPSITGSAPSQAAARARSQEASQ